MSVLVRIPTPLRAMTNGQGELQAEAATVKELINRLDEDYAGIKARLCEENGNVRRFINVYVNEEDIRFLRGTETPLKAGDKVSIVPAIAGGAGDGGDIRGWAGDTSTGRGTTISASGR